jgi:hypothetical protein
MSPRFPPGRAALRLPRELVPGPRGGKKLRSYPVGLRLTAMILCRFVAKTIRRLRGSEQIPKFLINSSNQSSQLHQRSRAHFVDL